MLPPDVPTASAALALTPVAAGIRVGRPVRRVFTTSAEPVTLDGDQRRFMVDLAGSGGFTADVGLFARGGGNSFTAMADRLLTDCGDTLPPQELAVLAYHTPDLNAAQMAGCYLTSRCAGGPTAFSVSEQGVGAPFTALRLLDAAYRAGSIRHGSVFVLDQGCTVLWDDEVHGRNVRDAAVLLATGPQGPLRLAWQREDVAADPSDVLGAIAEGRLVAGAGLAGRLPRDRWGRAIAGVRHHLVTGAWIAWHDAWRVETTTVADYDPHTGRLFTACFAPVKEER